MTDYAKIKNKEQKRWQPHASHDSYTFHVFKLTRIQLFQKALSEEKKKSSKPRPKGNNDLLQVPQEFCGHSSMSLRTVWNVVLQVRVLNVGQLLKQRWLEGLQTVGSFSKYNGDKRDREQHRFTLTKQQLNLHHR